MLIFRSFAKLLITFLKKMFVVTYHPNFLFVPVWQCQLDGVLPSKQATGRIPLSKLRWKRVLTFAWVTCSGIYFSRLASYKSDSWSKLHTQGAFPLTWQAQVPLQRAIKPIKATTSLLGTESTKAIVAWVLLSNTRLRGRSWEAKITGLLWSPAASPG